MQLINLEFLYLLAETCHAVVDGLLVGVEGGDDVAALAADEVGVAVLPVLLDVDLDGERGVDLLEDVRLVAEGVHRVRPRVRLRAQPAHAVRALQREHVLQTFLVVILSMSMTYIMSRAVKFSYTLTC